MFGCTHFCVWGGNVDVEINDTCCQGATARRSVGFGAGSRCTCVLWVCCCVFRERAPRQCGRLES
jgi:hypothetical protein